jgi:hypothetical protein
MNLRYILYSVDLDEEKILDEDNHLAPRGWADEQLTIKENEFYVGNFREYSGAFGFVKEINDWLLNIILTFGVESVVKFFRYVKLSDDPNWVLTDESLLNLSNFKADINFLEINAEDNSAQKNIKNYESTPIKYNSIYSLDGSALPGNVLNFQIIRLNGLTTGEFSAYTDIIGVLPFELFNRVLQKITNQNYNMFRSSLFGRTNLVDNGFDSNYPVNGYFAYMAVTNGWLIRGASPNNTDEEGIEGRVDLITEFKNLYAFFNSKKPIGMGIETEIVSGETRYFLRIEERNYFYKSEQGARHKIIMILG